MKKCIYLVLVLALVGNAQAAENNFTNNDGAGDNLWTTASNWSGGHVPTSDETLVGILRGGTDYCLINSDMAATPGRMRVGVNNNGKCELKITGGSLYVTDDSGSGEFVVGLWGGCHYSNVQQSGGTVTVEGAFRVNHRSSHCRYYLYDGLLTVESGVVEVNDGILAIMPEDGRIDIYSGTMKVMGDLTGTGTDQVQTLIDDGELVAYYGLGTINATYDGTYTVITATPEPATLALLGLGGLLLRRRR
jgi:hypothetical protein